MMMRILFLAVFLSASIVARAQSFSSGSTGADGALDLSSGPCQRQIQLPESGILNYTTIYIPTNCGVSFKPNFRNTPVIMLAQGSVIIDGQIIVNASTSQAGEPGPGGFNGGAGTNAIGGQNGFGPGGGTTGSHNGTWVGSLSLVPIVGGSGGWGIPGGGGGGAIVIASSGTIALSGKIWADGVYGANFLSTGSGGAIRLVANSINVSGSFEARGGFGISTGPGFCTGVVRLEAPAGSLTYTGSSDPLPILSTTINSQIVSDNSTPSLSITSIGGFPVSYTSGRPDSVDLILPNQINDPVRVVVQAHNIPVGTQVNLGISGPATGTFTPGTLSGTQTSSSTTIGVSGLSRAGATYLIAFVDFTLSASAANFNPQGPDQVAKVRVIARPGADPKFVFLRKNGSEIDLLKVPNPVRQQFGLK
jgi:hypothetical protein